jgi:hypothetical protein
MKPAVMAAVGGASVVGAVVLLSGLMSGRRSPRVALSDSAADEEAIARMLASENESGSEATLGRADLVAASQPREVVASGSASPPVWATVRKGGASGASDKPATAATRAYAARFLAELPPSSLPGARRFF